MKKYFHTTRKVVETKRDTYTFSQLDNILRKEKPTEIWHNQWSSKMPFIVITEYNGDGFLMYCNGHADKTPEQSSASALYQFLQYQGLGDCYINSKNQCGDCEGTGVDFNPSDFSSKACKKCKS